MAENQEIELRHALFKAQQHLVAQALQFARTRDPHDREGLVQAHRTVEALVSAVSLAKDVPTE
jgi:cytochrome c556